jgi:hypothetical protein
MFRLPIDRVYALTWKGEPYLVIGLWDLDAFGNPVNENWEKEFGEAIPGIQALLARGAGTRTPRRRLQRRARTRPSGGIHHPEPGVGNEDLSRIS